MGPDAGEVASALDRLLKSETFARSERARELLGYLVGKEQAGEAGQIKGFSIAQDVFGRDDAFDPATDAVVRVQAGRLRDLLSTYYDGEGADEPLEITIPRGGYTPEYVKRDKKGAPRKAAEKPLDAMAFNSASAPLTLGDHKPVLPADVAKAPVVVESDTPVSPFVVKNIRRFWAVLLSILGLLGLILFLLWQFGSEVTRQAERGNVIVADNGPGGPSRSVGTGDLAQWTTGLPTVSVVISEAKDAAEAATWTRMIANAAARFASVDFRAGEQGQAVYAISVAVAENGTAELSLVHQPSGSFVWSGTVYGEESGYISGGMSVGAAMTAMLPPSGAVYTDAAKRNGLGPLARCHWLTESFFLKKSRDLFVEAYDCHRGLDVAGQVSPLIHADLASLLTERLRDNLSYPGTASIEDAMRQARRSLETESTGEGYRALAAVLEMQGDRTGAEVAISKAVQLNPFNVNLLASYGYSLLNARAYGDAKDVLARAVRQVESVPTWWSYALFISAFFDGDLPTAYEASDALAGEGSERYLAARLIAAHGRGDQLLAERIVATLRASGNNAGWNAAQYYSRLYPADEVKKLLDALAAAGYAGPSG